ncbi:MAG: hypothetical protein QOH17_3995 [Pseudonocardiales bacterium]|jgi:hypothetical protein|nr:hypothetical protein [Pseudonocardiales bacterium]
MSQLRRRRLGRAGAASVAAACSLALSGCGGAGRVAAKLPTRFTHAPFTASDFGAPATGANRWLPLVPGTQWVRVGTTLVGHRPVQHRVVSTVTDVVKRIDGVSAVAVLDQDVDAGQIAQESLDWLAQDRRGTVWFVGAYTEEYAGGRYVTLRDAWLGGVKAAKPGTLMPADPTTRTPAWTIAQPPGADPDAAQPVATGQTQCVPFHCFQDVLVVREGKASALDNEFKYYAPGVGQILNTPKSASQHQDVEQLVNLVHLSRVGLSEFSAEALKLDRHARATSPDVFGPSAAATRAR